MKLKTYSLTAIAICLVISGCSSSTSMQVESDAPMSPEIPTEPTEPTAPTAPTAPTEPNIPNLSPEDPLTQGSAPLVPVAQAGSDTDRLFKGINRQVASTLLDLNARMRDGISLTDQQENCLGSFDPALGEQLLTINCEQPLTSADVSIYVEQASYYDTADCHAALFDGNTNDCILQSARLSIPTQWVVIERAPDDPGTVPNRPQPIAGVEIFYALNGSTNLRIENNEEAFTGTFQCDIDLVSGEANAPTTSQSCPTSITLAADRFDTLLPE